MTEKPKPNDPASTHVLDDEDIEELDELTLTSVIREAADLPEPEPLDEDEMAEAADELDFDILSPEK